MLPEKIKNKDDFINFVRELSKDFKNNSESWENKSVDEFLESLAAWVEDMDGYYLNKEEAEPSDVDWTVFAVILTGAKIYE